MGLNQKITSIHYGKAPKDDFAQSFLKFCSKVYELVSNIRNKLYDMKILEEVKVRAFVISVGNLTTGGVGKTPLVIKLAEYFIQKGEKVAVISRGYKGNLPNNQVNVISDGNNIFYDAFNAGDEPFMIANKVKKAIVITCKDRVRAAQYAIDKYKVSKIILDDGFQHRHLYRNLNIMMIDSNLKFGNGLLLPAGPLREPLSETKRADKIVVVSKNINHSPAEKMAKSIESSTNKPTTLFYIEPDEVYNIKTGEPLAFGESATAVCAIGQPKQFFAFVEKNYVLADKISFDDHHTYKPEDIENIKGNIITTEKDAVKLSAFDNQNIFALKLSSRIDFEELFS